MSFSVSPQMDLFPTKLNCAARTGGYIHHHYYYYWFLDLKKIQVVVRLKCTWKEDCEKDHHHQDIVFRAGSVFSRRLASGDAELTAQQIIDHHRADDGLGDFWRWSDHRK